MRVLVFASFAVSLLLLAGVVSAATIGTPSITSPSGGSEYTEGETFTLSASVSCSGPGNCGDTELTANLPSGLSTTSSNPQSCGNLKKNKSCSKSWTVSGDSAGTYSITVSVSSEDGGSATSDSISVTVNAEESEGETTTSTNTTSTTTTATTTTATTGDTEKTSVSVEIISPAAGSVFNRGDSVLVRASVGRKDIQVEATLGQTVQLFDDGTHGDDGFQDGVYANTITVPLLPAGPTELKVRISDKTFAGEDAIEVEVASSLSIEHGLKEGYSQGEEIVFSGKVLSASGEPLEDADVEISARLGDASFGLKTKSGFNGTIDGSYIVSFLDPVGNWTFNLTATDGEGNAGSSVFELPISPPSGGLSYTAKFTNPLPELVYERGDSVPIFVELFESGAPLSGANVTVRTSSGEIVRLRETTGGAYVGEYVIKFDDPTEGFSLTAIAVKNVEGKIRGGGNKIDLAVEPAKLRIELLTPDTRQFTVGEKVRISARALYPDGTLGTGLFVTALTPLNESIALEEIDPGVYQATYQLKEGEEGPWLVSVEAIDANVNSGATKQLVQVAPITVFYLVLQYWWAILAAASPGIYLGFVRGRAWYAGDKMRRLEEKIEDLTRMKKETQTKYYKEGSIDKKTHDRLMSRYEEEISRARSDLARLRDGAKKR